ncbi:MAG: carboxylesterase family protein, partial [Eubacteriales bacterium]
MLRKVRTENGWVRGFPAADPRITVFKGIPFAAPPVGKLRWHAPMPAYDWDGTLECYEFAPMAMQYSIKADPNALYDREWHVDPDHPMSEDCLYLNIWTPAKTGDEKFPVMVWIFGGGLMCGYPSEMEFDGERIARRGVILVSMNYRLNVFGFLCHPEITAENPEKPANFGHLDQQAGI